MYLKLLTLSFKFCNVVLVFIVPILVTSGFRCFCEPHSNVRSKVGLPIEGVQVDYLDTPGVGDMDVTPMKVLTLIEQEFLGLALAGPLFHLPSA